MMYTTILFDLDGTLLDTLADLAASLNHALTAHSLPLRTVEQTRAAVGNGVRMLLARSVPGGEENPAFEAALNTFRAHYAAHSLDHTAPYDGILPLLTALQRAGKRVAIVSNKFDAAVKDISAHFFGPLVPVAIGEAEERGIRKKPAPDTVLAALDQLGASREGAVYIGDSEVDVQTARNAGIPCISVTWGFRSQDELRAAGSEIFAPDARSLASLLGISLEYPPKGFAQEPRRFPSNEEKAEKS